ncbi:MAG TPA: transglycosylase domain-containing protein [Actinomycetota bacterium]|nr:transglycosylase domain-containing protein [Actinomycetota bacterium]
MFRPAPTPPRARATVGGRVVAVLLAGCLALAGCVSVRPLELVPPDRVAQTSLVLDSGGRTVAALHGPEDRTAVPLGEVSRWMRLAVVDTEDARFWGHGGVDWLAVARAAARDLERRRVVEGGSTITQQYVKNSYVSGERTLRRKLAEAGHAWGLEERNGKRAILEAYLNTVYFGQGAYGVEAAAQTYFSTGADRLSLTQAALLAGMIRAPAAYDPFRHPRAARARRASVLARMERNGHLGKAVRVRAAAAPLGLRPGDPASAGKARRPGRGDRAGAQRAPWFVGWVLDQLLDPADRRFDVLGTSRKARTDRVFTGGLRITTTVDLEAQAAAERAVAAVAGRRGRDPYGALVAVEPGTGAVRAMVGGRSWWDDARFGRVNLATGAGGGGRPAGSAFKVFALVAALERGIPPEAVFAAPDRLVVGRGGRGPAWRVANYEGHGFGKATLRTATALSINTVYAGLLLRLGGGDADRGARAVVEAAARMGVGSPLPAVPSAVLGTGEVTPLEMAAAYATLAAKGRRAAPFGVARITGADGRVLYQARPGADQAVKPAVAAIAADVLRGVVDRGTGVRGRIGRPAAGKTGTTQDHADAWFVGFTPSLATAVWVGYPQGQVPMVPPRTPSRVSGGTWPAAIWSGFMRAALAGEPHGRFPRPDLRLVKLALDLERGCLPNRFTPAAEVASVVYLKASAPTRTCREPRRPVAGVVPALVGVPVARAAGWLEEAGLSLVQRLAVDDAAAPGTVLAQSPAGGAARPAGAPVELTVAVDAQGAGGLGLTLVPEVLGQPQETARHLLDQAGLTPEVQAACDTDATRASSEPGRVWRSGPAPGAQAPTGTRVRLWVNPPGCPPPATTTTTRAGPTPTSIAER